MANPARVPDPSKDPRLNDPINPVPPADPFTSEARRPANDPRVVNRVENRSGGSSVLIAGIVLVLAVIAYFVFAPGSETVAPTEPATTTTTEPATPAPDATAPAAPADPVAPAPDATAPDATAPTAPADPAAPAPDAAAPAPAEPAAPAPAEPAPAQ